METVLPEGVARCSHIVNSKTKKICGCKFAVELKVLKGPRLVPTKLCPRHRAYRVNYVERNRAKVAETKRQSARRPEAKVALQKRRDSTEGKAARAREAKRDRENGSSSVRMNKHRSKPDVQAARRLKAKTPKVREQRRKAHHRRMEDPGYKLMFFIQCKVGRMLRANNVESRTVKEHTSLKSNHDLRAHVASTFPSDGSMTWKNYGRKAVSKEDADLWLYWELGHRIAQSMYNPLIREDMKRCWSFENLFAQNAKENNNLRVRLPSDDELLKIRTFWPVAWNDTLPSAARRVELERAATRGEQPRPR